MRKIKMKLLTYSIIIVFFINFFKLNQLVKFLGIKIKVERYILIKGKKELKNPNLRN